MAHIHLEDGSFTLLWVLVWWIIALVLIGAALYLLKSRNTPDPKKITIAAFVATAAFAIFQVQIPIFGGVHLNLTPLIGILTGPLLGTLIIFVVNILSAAIGHGGWGLVGANILVNFSEVTVAWFVYRIIKKITPNLFSQAGISTFSGLFVGNLVMIGIILVSGIQGVHQTPTEILSGLSLLATVNMGVAAIEACISGFVVTYISRIRPDIVEGDQR
ncbi:MAG TPA: energy-coupling factor ABC transporter permease [Methanospirillum sp.]|nr:energy-coupling factor ABC transporter permease [Methanospirillum sp.]